MSGNKIALISGANKGIGFETARQLLAQGHHVYLGARRAADGEAAAAKLGPGAAFIHIDLANPGTFVAAAQKLEQLHGRLDVLVNNAGVAPDNGTKPSETPIGLILDSFSINVFGLVELTQRMLPLLRKSEAGRIVNLSSILGSLSVNSDPKMDLGEWRSFGYNGSKAAVNMFTVTLAHELRDTKIKVNSAHPGWVKTDMGGEAAPMEASEGATTSVWLATLPDDGPSGGYFHKQDRLPW
jgi:NAD(P)-dependent dehydrogenase (short-subunit alcohol dehydrogenase family)